MHDASTVPFSTAYRRKSWLMQVHLPQSLPCSWTCSASSLAGGLLYLLAKLVAEQEFDQILLLYYMVLPGGSTHRLTPTYQPNQHQGCQHEQAAT